MRKAIFCLTPAIRGNPI